MSSWGLSFIKLGESWHVLAVSTLLTYLICMVVLHVRNLRLREVKRFIVAKPAVGLTTLYKFHFALGLTKAQGGLLC